MLDIPIKATGDLYLASELNSAASELETAVTATGQTLNGSFTDQLASSMAQVASGGQYFESSGAPGTYALAVGPSTTKEPHALVDGLRAVFVADKASAGSDVVNLAGLGAQNLMAVGGGAAVATGEIASGDIVEVIYRLPTNTWEMLPGKSYVDQSSPVGMITAWNPGYFTDGVNGGFVAVLSANDVSSANSYLNPKGWYVCDGALLDLPNSPIFNGANRYLPNLTDARFLMGSAGAGGGGGTNTTAGHVHTLPGHSHAHHLAIVAEGSHVHGMHGSTAGGGVPYRKPLTSAGDNYDTSYPIIIGHMDASGSHIHGITGWVGGGINADTDYSSSANTASENRPLYLSTFYIMKVI